MNLTNVKVLIGGEVPSVIEFIAQEFSEAGCQTRYVVESGQLMAAIDEFDPDIIVVDVQTEAVSTYQIVRKLEKMPKMKIELLLYSFFVDPELAKDSIVHRLFATQPQQIPRHARRPIRYLGIFKKEIFANKIKSFLTQEE